MKLNEKIYKHRRQLGISQEELAERLGVTRQAVSKWELGASLPELDTVVALAKTFGVTTDYLLTETEAAPQPEKEAPQPALVMPEWLDRLPGTVGRFLRRFGWLSGVYVAVLGGAMALLGLAARLIAGSMTRSFQNTVDSMFGTFQSQTGDAFGMMGFGTPVFEGFQESVSAMTRNDPVSILGTVLLVLGLLLLAGGTALALYLKKRFQ